MPRVWKGDNENKSKVAWEKTGPWAYWDTGLGSSLDSEINLWRGMGQGETLQVGGGGPGNPDLKARGI